MNKPAPRVLGMITGSEGFIRHLVDMHTQMPGTPSPDDMRKYPAVMAKMVAEHDDLHVHFYTGHEHQQLRGVNMIVEGRTS